MYQSLFISLRLLPQIVGHSLLDFIISTDLLHAPNERIKTSLSFLSSFILDLPIPSSILKYSYLTSVNFKPLFTSQITYVKREARSLSPKKLHSLFSCIIYFPFRPETRRLDGALRVQQIRVTAIFRCAASNNVQRDNTFHATLGSPRFVSSVRLPGCPSFCFLQFVLTLAFPKDTSFRRFPLAKLSRRPPSFNLLRYFPVPWFIAKRASTRF